MRAMSTAADARGGGMKYYIDRGYVPEGIEGKGGHKDGASMTLEYAYQDWCLAQLALALGHADDAKWLLERSGNYRNVWDPAVQSMRPRNKDGSWLTPFERVGPQCRQGLLRGQRGDLHALCAPRRAGPGAALRRAGEVRGGA